MFGLPAFTATVLIAIPLLWFIYTAAFMVMSRNWGLADEPDANGASISSTTEMKAGG